MPIVAIKPIIDKTVIENVKTENIDNKDIYVGAFLKEKRKEHNLKIHEVAEFLGVAVYTYKGYEAAADASYYRLPPLSILINLTRLYNITLDEMLGLEQEREAIEFRIVTSTKRPQLKRKAK
jgi:transcriptional regulator with XRE-family HTH domain